MKIGIMSMQRIINYGSFLQALGLKQTIKAMGHTVEFVDYEIGKPIAENTKEVSGKNNKLLRALKIAFSAEYRRKRKESIESAKAINDFNNTFRAEWIPMLGVTENYNYTPELDVLIIGSDEVFNCTQSNPDVGYSPQLFGYNHKANKLITYAASFGSTTIDKLKRYGKAEEVSEHLKTFDAISVRDSNSHSIVNELTDIEPTDSIDPVLLYDFSNEVKNINIDLKDYIIVYSYADRITDEEAAFIQNFAHKRGKKLWQSESFRNLSIYI